MPTIRYASTGRCVTFEEGTEANILRQSIRYEAGVPYRCGGGLCGTCKVFIESGAENLTEIKKQEVNKLGEELLKKGYRLACQSFAKGDVTLSWDTSVTVNVPEKIRALWLKGVK